MGVLAESRLSASTSIFVVGGYVSEVRTLEPKYYDLSIDGVVFQVIE